MESEKQLYALEWAEKMNKQELKAMKDALLALCESGDIECELKIITEEIKWQITKVLVDSKIIANLHNSIKLAENPDLENQID